jgi:hypothetical protein
MIVSCRSRSSVRNGAGPPATQHQRWCVHAGVVAALIAVATASCSSNTTPPPPGSSQNPSAQRLAWSQPAASQALVQNYEFILFIDGVRTALSGATCTGMAPALDCLAPLPALAPGRHLLELSALDRTNGLESGRSEQLVTNTTAGATAGAIFGTVRPPITSAANVEAAESGTSASARPAVACAESRSTCLAITTKSDNLC